MQHAAPSTPPVKGRHLYKHGLCSHPLYGRWRGMVQRCTDPNYKAFKHYGGRGIRVCERWLEFPVFLSDMGLPPDGYQLDRLDPDGPYDPSNCAWVNKNTQMRNTRRSPKLIAHGQAMGLADWADHLGVNKATLKSRLDAGWPLEKALTNTKFSTNGKPRP